MKHIWFVLGSVFMLIGGIGILIPVLPTTPLIIMAAFCFGKSNKRITDWLIHDSIFQPYLYHYKYKLGVPIRAKVLSLCYLYGSIMITIVVQPNQFIDILLVVIALAVTAHILSLKTNKDMEYVKTNTKHDAKRDHQTNTV